MAIDADLKGRTWLYYPAGIPGVERRGGIDVYHYDEDLYGEPPYRFRVFRQNGSRAHRRLLAGDGTDARDADGGFVERRAYTSDLRRGVYWKVERDDA